MNNQAEVIIIGGGIMGVSIAYNLAKRGKDVVLIERGELCSGVSSRTEALLSMRENTHPEYTELSWRSYETYKTLADELGSDFEHEIVGGLKLVHNADEMKAAEKLIEESRAAGYDIFRLMMPDEIKEKEPLANPKALAGIYSPYDGTLNPFLLVDAYAQAATRLGARIYRYTDVTDFSPSILYVPVNPFV
jgi:glycine/D-amino acid oxidase-like deaminating enzyme